MELEMKQTKRWLSATMAGVMMCGLLAGCGGGDDQTADTGKTDSQDGASSGAADKTVVKVQWIGDFKADDATDPISGETNKGLHVLEEEFEKQHPDIDVQFVLMGWDDYQKKTQSMMIAGECDVYQAPGIAALADQGLLEPLQPYIDRDSFDLGVYIDGQVDGWKCAAPEDTEQQIYGLPMIGDTRFIIYDKQIFDEWGVPYLSETPTPEEVLEAAKKMTGKNPVSGKDNYGVFHKGTDAADAAMNLNEYYGGTWGEGIRAKDMKVNFDTPEMKKAFEFIKELNQYAPAGVMANQGGEMFGTADNNIAINMRANPAVINNVEAQGLNDRYAVARLYINADKGHGGMFAGSPVVIAQSSKVKDAAWEYVKFTGSEFFMNYFWENQRNEGLPVLKAALEISEVKSNANVTAMLNSMPYLWTPRYTYRAGQAHNNLITAIEDYTLNNVPVAEALAKAQKETDEWIAAQ